MHIYICNCIHIITYLYIYTRACMYIYIYIHTYICVCVCTYTVDWRKRNDAPLQQYVGNWIGLRSRCRFPKIWFAVWICLHLRPYGLLLGSLMLAVQGKHRVCHIHTLIVANRVKFRSTHYSQSRSIIRIGTISIALVLDTMAPYHKYSVTGLKTLF